MQNCNEKKLRVFLNKIKTERNLKQVSIAISLLPLAACGGGGGGSNSEPISETPIPEPPTPEPIVTDFIESPSNVFIALDNLSRTLSEGSNTAHLTVIGKDGSDTITTGSGNDVIIGAGGNDNIISNGGNDLIRMGEGIDNLNAGAGDDAIVVVGTTTPTQYSNDSITNSGGSGFDLSRLITLSDLNNRSVSEIMNGEIIDGGSGTNTLYIYGTVDLTGVTLNNITILIVNSDVTLTPEQIAAFTTIDGDGNSVINIEVPTGSSDNYILDLSALTITDVGSINIDGDITVVIEDENDISGVGVITVGTGDTLKLQVNGTGNVDLTTINETFDQVDNIELDENVTLEINNASDITDLGLSEITGSGSIDTNGSETTVAALNNITVAATVNTAPVAVDDSDTITENQSILIDVLANDTDAENDTLSITAVSLVGTKGTVTIESGQIRFDPGTDFDDLDDTDGVDITINYTVSDGDQTDQGSITVTVNGANDNPVAVVDSVTITENQSILFDALANDSDAENNTLSITDVTLFGTQGSVTIEDGHVRFNPGTDFDYLNVGDSQQTDVAYTVSDGGLSSEATISFTVEGQNDAPIALDDTAFTTENIALSIDLLSNDTDVDSDITLIDVTDTGGNSNHGALTIINNSLWFDPEDDFDYLSAGESYNLDIVYTVSDGEVTDQANLTLTITGENDAPTAVNDAITILMNDISLLIDAKSNDIDPDDTLTITSAGISIDNGIVTVVDNKIQFETNNDFDHLAIGESEIVYINYTITDGEFSDTARVEITVYNSNEAPIANNDTASAYDNETILIDVLANDAAIEGDVLTIASIGAISADFGVASIVENKIEFTPGNYFYNLLPGESEDFTFNYTLTNSTSYDTASVTVTINGILNGPLTITGTDNLLNYETLQGAEDDDVFYGSLGEDVINGYGGIDTLTYELTNYQVNINLWSLANIVLPDDNFIYDPINLVNYRIYIDSVENIIGSNYDNPDTNAYADTLKGDDNNNIIKGLAGNDYLVGFGGNDTLYGGDGDDTLIGNDGDDILYGDAGNDSIIYVGNADIVDGGADIDTVYFSSNDAIVNYDLSTISLSNIEIIDITYTAAQTISLSLQDLLDITDSNNHLIINGNSNDIVNFTDANWTQGTDQSLDDITYSVYTSGAGTLLVESSINNPDIIYNHPNFELSTLSGSDGSFGFHIHGIDAGDFAGRFVSNVGDFNNDGYDDFIISAHSADPNDGNSGETYLIYGRGDIDGNDGDFYLSSLASGDGTFGFVLNGREVGDNSGYSISNAGDINADGFDDIMIGAYTADSNTTNTGETYIIYGGNNVDGGTGEFELSTLATGDGTYGFQLNGYTELNRFGYAVSNAGDFNNDGYDDIIIGAYGADRAYLLYGGIGIDGGDGVIDITSLIGNNGLTGFEIYGGANVSSTGRSVSNAGDINNDGFDDLIIGATDESFILYGGINVDGGDGVFDLSSLESNDGSFGFQLNTELNSNNTSPLNGKSVSSAGDFNADGYDDFIVSSPYADPNDNKQAGETYLIYGSADIDGGDGNFELSTLAESDGSFGFQLNGIKQEHISGYSTSNAGDVNGDGYDDIIIGAFGGDTNGTSSGESYVIYGGINVDGGDGVFELSELSTGDGSKGFQINGIDEDDRIGWSVSNAGDVNNDGYADLLVGSLRLGAPGSVAGEAYIVYGAATSLNTIMGTNGSDNLTGTTNDERFIGRDGNDTISTGSGMDVIVFEGNWGDDTILDFSQGSDILDFSDSDSINDISDLIVSQSNGDTIIDDGLGNTITLNSTLITLNNADFDFL